ncbi:uncharacterized protein LOC124639870 [Helicoverpa zea]|uniref:uncharacterized protein LOC124639870 n=1 Tax=Helicoverpa zea TaxID=7113 RepID=UPI001F56D239|nr:uncharacterized protein LOC124639870 [Helicoverpa zea]
MAFLYIIVALAIQGSFTYANVTDSEECVNSGEIKNDIPDVYYKTEGDDQVVKDYSAGQKDWIDFFLLPDANLYPTSSVAMMSQATNSDKSVEEQLEEIKEIAQKITLAIQSEMANLLTYAINSCDKGEGEEVEGKGEGEDNHLRRRRSMESPMASTELVTRLLKHIKSNNEYQNIAIDKMMTAQEIADKYGIEFSPDTEILSDLAMAANHQAEEMNSLLQESLEMKNVTRKAETAKVEALSTNKAQDNDGYFSFTIQYPDQPAPVNVQPAVNHHHHADSYPSYNYYYNYPETQIPAPPTQSYYSSPPVSKRPDFYDTVSYIPQEYSYCAMEPMTSASTIIMPFEEILEPEPELVGEELEDTVSSKVYVDRGDEPGSATVSHVMTYTVGEKSHFRTPAIERLPQQMQYCFFLM